MKNFKFNFKSIVQRNARWLLTLFAILTLGVGEMWAYSITIYVIPKAIWGNDWTEGSSKVKIWWKFGSTSTAEYMSKTVWTYDGDCIYAYTVNDVSSDGLDYLEFQRFSSADAYQTNHTVYSSWKEASNFGGKIFKGEWSEGDPTWHTFGRDITIYGVPKTMDGSKWVEGSHTLYANFKVGDSEWKKQQMTKTANTYAGNPIYKCTMLIKYNVIKIVQFLYNDGSDHNLYDYTPGSQHSTDDIDGKIFRGYIGSTHKWSTYEVDHTIAAGSTIVWDLGQNNINDGNDNWSSVYLYKSVSSSSADPTGTNDEFTILGSSTQYTKTYNSAVNYIGAWLFRNNTSNWNAHTQTTNIDNNVSGLTLYTYCNTESSNKLDWHVTTDAKRGATGRTIYFDDTYTSWKNHEAENREIYFNYGVDWDGGGYHRKIDFEVEKVPGTANLYKLKASSEDATNTGATNSSGQFDHDIYFQKWYVSKYYGYTNHNPITDSHVLERTEIYTDAITTNDFTLIPTSKKSGGSGEDGSPYIWNTTQKTGHTWNVSINAPSHGTITVGYTNESGSSASLTSGNADVAHTCILTITAAAANGYDDPETVSINSGTLANEGNYTIRENITVSATFSPHRYGITLNAGDHGVGAGSATVDFDATSLNSVTHVSPNAGYILEGYYDGSTKVLNANGSFAADDVTGYITDGKWSKTSDAILTAKFSPVTLTFVGKTVKGYTIKDSNWHDPECWSPQCVPTIEHDVVIQYRACLYGPYSASTGAYGTFDYTTRHGKAKSIVIDKTVELGEGHPEIQLKIWTSSSLIVAEDITVKKVVDEVTLTDQPTTPEDLYIETSILGNGGLICGEASANTQATYDFYTKTYKSGKWFINQYVGIPFASINANQYYGFNIYEYDATKDDWGTPKSSTLEPFTAYNFIRQYSGGTWMNFDLKGTLNLPGTESGTKVLTCGYRGEGSSIDGISGHEDYMFANSWTAPIHIASMTSGDFSGTSGADLVQTIYIFNAGYIDPEAVDPKILGDEAGQWSSFPIAAAGEMENALIPATQAFMVTSKKGSSGATLTLDYSKHVYAPAIANDSIDIFPTRAPRRGNAVDSPVKLRMIVRCDSTIADELYLFERGDFKPEFDNGWDGTKIFGESFAPQLYAVHGDGKYAVDAIPDMEGTKLAFKAGTKANSYTFSFDYEEQEEPLYLYDKDENKFTEISKEATYSFTTSDTKEHERFVITRKAPQIVTGFEEVEGEKMKGAEKFIENNMLFIRRGDRVYNAEGVLVK